MEPFEGFYAAEFSGTDPDHKPEFSHLAGQLHPLPCGHGGGAGRASRRIDEDRPVYGVPPVGRAYEFGLM